MQHSFLMHNSGDDVAVAIMDIGKGQEAVVVAMDTGEERSVRTRAAVPLGHKVALRGLAKGDTVHKYGVSIGTVTADIGAGDHVHTHNLRSARW